MGKLEKLRKGIDVIDGEILKLLNDRASLAMEIGREKKDRNVNCYSPEREKEVMENMLRQNPGPLSNEALRVLYREIMSASRSLEEPLKVAYFGPLATFTHLAAIRHFGSSADFLPAESIKNVFAEVDAGRAAYGVVPIENSNEGVVNYTLDMFVDSDLKVAGEIMLEISQNLLSRSGQAGKVKRIYSFLPATAQCKVWLEKNMPAVPVIDPGGSTARAAEIASGDDEAAAIASEAAAGLYNLKFVARGIEDGKHNFTRFLVIGRDCPKKTGRDKTSIMFSIKDRPGALFDILSPLKKAGINLTKIESRPSKRKAWEYIFFMDMKGHMEDKPLKKAIERIKQDCLYLKILGSYPMVEDDKSS
ncbi:MAG: prephenate dehydratase [Nitrospiraceae bacterium]|nr:prephenate dehydratase [Nitrospiraceae bacterium]